MGSDVDAADTADADAEPGPMDDAEAWTALSREEQSDILDEGLADLRGEAGEGAWRHLSDGAQRRTRDAIERDPDSLSETEQAMQAALDETWTAEVFADVDDAPTVPFECRELSAHEQSVLQEAAGALMDLEAHAESLDDASPDDLDDVDLGLTHFDSVADLEAWIPAFLADVTVDDAFDEERFRTGHRLRTNTRRLLLIEVFLRYHEEAERAIRFRTE